MAPSLLLSSRSSAMSGCHPFGLDVITSSRLESIPSQVSNSFPSSLCYHISSGLSRSLVLDGVSTSEIDAPNQCSMPVPTDSPTPESTAHMADSQSFEWIDQRMIEVSRKVSRKLGLITNGQERLLLSYLATIRDFKSTLVKIGKKDKTARELTRLSTSINYSRRKQIGFDAPRRIRGDK